MSFKSSQADKVASVGAHFVCLVKDSDVEGSASSFYRSAKSISEGLIRDYAVRGDQTYIQYTDSDAFSGEGVPNFPSKYQFRVEELKLLGNIECYYTQMWRFSYRIINSSNQFMIGGFMPIFNYRSIVPGCCDAIVQRTKQGKNGATEVVEETVSEVFIAEQSLDLWLVVDFCPTVSKIQDHKDEVYTLSDDEAEVLFTWSLYKPGAAVRSGQVWNDEQKLVLGKIIAYFKKQYGSVAVGTKDTPLVLYVNRLPQIITENFRQYYSIPELLNVSRLYHINDVGAEVGSVSNLKAYPVSTAGSSTKTWQSWKTLIGNYYNSSLLTELNELSFISDEDNFLAGYRLNLFKKTGEDDSMDSDFLLTKLSKDDHIDSGYKMPPSAWTDVNLCYNISAASPSLSVENIIESSTPYKYVTEVVSVVDDAYPIQLMQYPIRIGRSYNPRYLIDTVTKGSKLITIPCISNGNLIANVEQ